MAAAFDPLELNQLLASARDGLPQGAPLVVFPTVRRTHRADLRRGLALQLALASPRFADPDRGFAEFEGANLFVLRGLLDGALASLLPGLLANGLPLVLVADDLDEAALACCLRERERVIALTPLPGATRAIDLLCRSLGLARGTTFPTLQLPIPRVVPRLRAGLHGTVLEGLGEAAGEQPVGQLFIGGADPMGAAAFLAAEAAR